MIPIWYIFFESDSTLYVLNNPKPKTTHMENERQISVVCVWNKANHFLLSDFDILTLRTNECQKNLRLPIMSTIIELFRGKKSETLMLTQKKIKQ